jgi:hypothetical protein
VLAKQPKAFGIHILSESGQNIDLRGADLDAHIPEIHWNASAAYASGHDGVLAKGIKPQLKRKQKREYAVIGPRVNDGEAVDSVLSNGEAGAYNRSISYVSLR